jgi:hypothetical protein
MRIEISPKTTLVFEEVHPEAIPEGALDNIYNSLKYSGIFKPLDKFKPSSK